MGPAGAIRDGAVAFAGERILAVGPFTEVRDAWPDAQVVGSDVDIVLPGLVNAHTHLNEGLLLGLGTGYRLFEWAERVVYPTELVITREQARAGALVRVIEAAESGTTTVCDMFCHNNPGSGASLGAVDAIEDVGLRGLVSYGPEDRYADHPLAAYVDEQEALAERCTTSPRVGYMLGIGTILGVSEGYLDWAVAECRRTGAVAHTHLCEVREEITECRRRHGLTTPAFCAHRGLLDHPTLAAHCIWLSEADRRLLRERDVRVVHNPVSNMRLASGICDLPRLLGDGLRVGLGTDGSASNDSQNMLGVAKTALLLQRVATLDATALSCEIVVELATIGGARSLGIDHEVGSLEPGKRADVVRLDGREPTMAPVNDPFAHVVLVCTGREVADVWVDGQPVVTAGRAARVDVGVAATSARRHAADLLRSAGVDMR